MKATRRYHFWKVFWVVLATNFFGMVIGVAFISLNPISQSVYKWERFLEWRRILGQAVGILFTVFFFYFTLNKYYRLFAAKRGVVDFIRASAGAFVVLAIYSFCSYYFISGKTAIAIGADTGFVSATALDSKDSLYNHNDTAAINKTGALTAPGTTSVEHKKQEGKTGPDAIEKMISDAPIAFLILTLGVSIIFEIGLSVLIAYLTYLRDEKKQRKILEEQKMQLEVEKSQANFNFLKAQINPHFLHNTLNFLYAKSLPYSPELSEGILTLSEIMRYALSEGNAKDGRAPLKDEIEHVRNVIKINQLRFSNKLNVKFDVEGVVNGAEIIPFVLITLVENAFKHGDLKSSDHPIEVKLKVEADSIYFFCRNKKKTGPRELSTGIGLDNIRKRLELAYGKRYSFVVKDEADIYTTELTISRL